MLQYKKQLKTAKGGAKNSIKQRALRVLKQKKMYEAQRDNQSQQAFNMEQTSFALENLKETATTVEAMKDTAKELKKQYKTIKIDKIEDIQDDLADLMMDADEVQEVLGRSYGVGDEVDEDELDDELAALDDEMFEDEVGEAEAEAPSYLGDDLPAAPDAAVAKPEGKQTEDEYGLPVAQ